MSDVHQIASQCDRFLNGHERRTVRELVQSIADSPLSLMRNDGYGRGGFLADFELEIAQLLGKEAALFMPSGTMAQQIALRIWSDLAGIKDVAFHPTCHLEIHEFEAYRHLHGLNGILLGEADRLFTLEDLEHIDRPLSTLLIELPQREIGGQLPSWDTLREICRFANSRGTKLHLHGARLWECRAYYQCGYDEICAPFDSVYVSFYKVLNGLPGAALAGPSSFIEEAKVWQRRHGGNLQQQSPSVIAAKLGLEHHLPRIPEYVRKAGEIARILHRFEQVQVIPQFPPTNMMHVQFKGDPARLVLAAIQIAKEEKIGLFFGLPPNGKLELNIGTAALQLSEDEVEALFNKLFSAL